MNNKFASTVENGEHLPAATVCISGQVLDLSQSIWTTSDAFMKFSINWTEFDGCDRSAVYALKLYLIRLFETRSLAHAENIYYSVKRFLLGLRANDELENQLTLKSLMWHLEMLRTQGIGQRFSYIRTWYFFSTDRALPGFDEETAFELEGIKTGSAARGESVLSADPDEGPLSALEEAALRRALIADDGSIEERAAVWLCLAFGPNPANISLLREDDFTSIEFENESSTAYFLDMPRIKKRMLARVDFKQRHVDHRLASIIQELIRFNSSIHPETDGPRPLFRRRESRSELAQGTLREFRDHVPPAYISTLVITCVKRLNVISPRTKRPLRVTPRRLRYTFACKMVRHKISPQELALLLDHSDTNSVDVYYKLDSRFAERLDETVAIEMGPFVKAFMGTLVPRSNQSDTLIPYLDLPELGGCGADFTCALAPHRSCYTCSKFEPFSDGPHDKVLTELVVERNDLISSGMERLAEQLDETILAVGEVLSKIADSQI